MQRFEAGTEFVMKAPFITNKCHFHCYPKTVVAMMSHVRGVLHKMYDQGVRGCFAVPYIMLQVRVKCNDEVKLVFAGGKFQFTASFDIDSIKKRFRGVNDEELQAFGEDVLSTIAVHDHYILEGVVRVDVFRNCDCNIVVNELESLEACCPSTSLLERTKLSSFLVLYWESIIYHCFESLK